MVTNAPILRRTPPVEGTSNLKWDLSVQGWNLAGPLRPQRGAEVHDRTVAVWREVLKRQLAPQCRGEEEPGDSSTHVDCHSTTISSRIVRRLREHCLRNCSDLTHPVSASMKRTR